MIKNTLFAVWIVLFLSACGTNVKPLVIYTIGDSTMADKKPEVYPETGWCQVLPDYFDESVSVKNHAVNGRSSKSFIDQGRWETVLDSLHEGDVVFIQFGHNDQKDYDSTRYTTPFGTYADNLKRFVKESREKGAIPVLLTPIVRRKFQDNGTLKDTHGDYPVAMRQVASELQVALIDLQKLTEEWVQSLGDEPSKEMYCWTKPDSAHPEGRKDDTHLSEKGAREVAKMALKECERQKMFFSDRINIH